MIKSSVLGEEQSSSSRYINYYFKNNTFLLLPIRDLNSLYAFGAGGHEHSNAVPTLWYGT